MLNIPLLDFFSIFFFLLLSTGPSLKLIVSTKKVAAQQETRPRYAHWQNEVAPQWLYFCDSFGGGWWVVTE